MSKKIKCYGCKIETDEYTITKINDHEAIELCEQCYEKQVEENHLKKETQLYEVSIITADKIFNVDLFKSITDNGQSIVLVCNDYMKELCNGVECSLKYSVKLTDKWGLYSGEKSEYKIDHCVLSINKKFSCSDPARYIYTFNYSQGY